MKSKLLLHLTFTVIVICFAVNSVIWLHSFHSDHHDSDKLCSCEYAFNEETGGISFVGAETVLADTTKAGSDELWCNENGKRVLYKQVISPGTGGEASELPVYVKISFDPKNKCHYHSNSLVQTFFVAFLFLLPSVYLISKSLDRNIFQRLKKIQFGLNNIISDRASPALSVERDDELTAIVRNINTLHTEVLEKEKQLVEARNDMEVRVYRRTAELARSYEELKNEHEERIKAEKEAEKHRQQLIQDDKLKTLGVLSAGVAHEINNPNNFIMLNIPILRDVFSDTIQFMKRNNEDSGETFGALSIDELEEAVPQLLDGITSGSERITKIVSSLKRYSQKSSVQKPKAVNVNEVIREALPLMDSFIKKSTDNFRLELSDELSLTCGDSSQIEQVIVNLVQNSCLALDGRDKAVIIRTYDSHEEGSITIEVEDEGKGIPTEYIENIQDPFFTTRRDSGGTGLGLSISTNIARAHNGKLLFESQPGEGTVARLVLPASSGSVCE